VWTTISKILKNHPAIKMDALVDPTKQRNIDFSIKVGRFFFLLVSVALGVLTVMYLRVL